MSRNHATKSKETKSKILAWQNTKDYGMGLFI